MKKICCVIDCLGSGGAQRQMVMLARMLKRHGYDITVVTYFAYDHFRGDLDNAGITEICVSAKSSMQRLTKMRRTIRKLRPDAIIAFLKTPNLCGLFASPGFRRIPTIVSERSLDGQITSAVRMQYQAYRLADALVCNSCAHAEFVNQKFPWLRKKTHVITNCVDFERFPLQAVEFDDQRSNLDSTLSMSVVATIVQRKNAIELLEALQRIRLERPGLLITVDWYGTHLSESESRVEFEYFQSLTQRIEELGMADRFLLHGNVSDVAAAIRKTDVLMLASYREGFPNAICEAMTCGLPVLASRIADNARLVPDGVGGFLFDPADPQDISRAILEFADCDLIVRKRMSERNLEFAKQEFSPERFYDRYRDLLNQVVSL